MEAKKILYIGNNLSKERSTVTTIATLSSALRKEGVVVYISSSVPNKMFRFLDMLLSTFIYRNKVDLVLIDTYSTQNFYYAVAVAKLCRFFKLPYIPILHGGDLPSRLDKSPGLSKKLFEGAKTNVTPSRYLFEAFKAKGYHKLALIPNTIEIGNYPFLRRKKPQAKLLWVRSFSSIYNPLLAIEVMKLLKEQGVNSSLCMVGPEKDGSLAKCKMEAEKHGLAVTFTGKLTQSEWTSLAAEYDIFINTTNFDNTPVSVMEAMALGLGIVSTNVGGIPYLIDHNETGILVSPNNAQDFVNAIVELVTNDSLFESLTSKARQMVEVLDWHKVKKQWLALITN